MLEIVKIPTVLLTVFVTISMASIVVWFFWRRNNKKLWMPILSVLDLPEKRPVPLLAKPPIFSFICFVLVVACLLFYLFQPSRIMFNKEKETKINAHIIVDLSPSVSASATIGDIGKIVANFYSTLSSSVKTTIMTTHSKDPLAITNTDSVVSEIIKLGFHYNLEEF